MEIRVDKIRRYLELVKPAVPKSPKVAVLKNVRFMDKQLTANDLETIILVNVPEMNGDAFLLPYRQSVDLLKNLPGDLMLTIVADDKFIRLSWAGGRASYLIANVKDYPENPPTEMASEADLDGDLLIRAMTDALQYTAKDDTKPVMAGVHLYLGDGVQVAGADGFRCSYESLKMSYPEKRVVIVPPAAVNILDYLWHKEPGKPALGQSMIEQLTAKRPLTLGLWADHMRVKFGNITVIAALTVGTPPDILQLISGFKEEIKIKVFGPELLLAVKRLANIAGESSNIIYLKWAESTLIVAAQSESSGSSMTEIPIDPGATPGRIAVNYSYLVEYLTGKEGFVTMGTKDRTSPAVFHFGQKPLVAVMPMHANWADDPKPEPKEEPAAETSPDQPTAEVGEPAEDKEEPGEEAEAETEEGEEEETTETVAESEPVAATPGKKLRRGRKKKENPE